MKQNLALSLAALLLPLSAAAANEPETPREIGVEASIAFPAYGTVRNFEADGDDGIWIEDQHRDWYYATLVGYCPDLNFAEAIGIDTRGTSRLDKFGAVIVKGQRCSFTSFVTAEKPLPRKERLKAAKAAKEAEKAVEAN